MWLNLAIHFVSRGLEFHQQLRRNSFEFLTDDDGLEFARLTHETQQKNFQGGLSKDEAPQDRRMYATNINSCPVALLKLLLAKTDPTAEFLFNSCNKIALTYPSTTEVWFTNTPLSARTYTLFMGDICKQSKTSSSYTAHSLRATAIHQLSNLGMEARHIMFMSGHRNEASLRSYTREPSNGQKRMMSNALSLHPMNSAQPLAVPSLAIAPPTSAMGIVSNTAMYSRMHAQTGFGDVLTSGTFHNCNIRIDIHK